MIYCGYGSNAASGAGAESDVSGSDAARGGSRAQTRESGRKLTSLRRDYGARFHQRRELGEVAGRVASKAAFADDSF